MDNNKNTINRYDLVAEQYAETHDDSRDNDVYLDEFLSYLQKGDKILDLGCGTGRITAYYAKKGFSVVGTDLSEKMLAIARKKHPELIFLRQDMRKIDFPENSFDAISLAYSLFHLTKKEASVLLADIYSALKDNGIVILILQEGSGEGMFQDSMLADQKIFLNLYSEEEIRELLQKNNVSVLSVKRKMTKPGMFPFNKLIIIGRLKK